MSFDAHTKRNNNEANTTSTTNRGSHGPVYDQYVVTRKQRATEIMHPQQGGPVQAMSGLSSGRWQVVEDAPTNAMSDVNVEQNYCDQFQPYRSGLMWTADCEDSQAQTSCYSTLNDCHWIGAVDCDPLSTLLPEAAWSTNPSYEHCAEPNYKTSPGPSDWSTNSPSPALSSPYIQSEPWSSDDKSRIMAQGTIYGPSKALQSGHDLPNYVGLMDNSLMIDSHNMRPLVAPPTMEGRLATAFHNHSIDTLAHDDRNDNDHVHPYHHHSPHRSAHSSDIADGSLSDQEDKASTPTEKKSPDSDCYCERCGRTFARSYNLRTHMQTHDPQRKHPHVCTYSECDVRFVRRADLQRHVLSVHKKHRGFECKRCKNAFARRDTLQRHEFKGCHNRVEMRSHAPRPRRSYNSAVAPRSRRLGAAREQSVKRLGKPLPTPPGTPPQLDQQQQDRQQQ